MIEFGYLNFKDTTSISDGDLFIKKIAHKFFLTLGFVISRFYDSKFTASFYLSKTTRWGSFWGDIPKESYRRIADFLKNDERKKFLDSEHMAESISDGWWQGTESEILKFLDVVKITEQRFLEQEGLFQKIDSSIEVSELSNYSSSVINSVNIYDSDENNYLYIPSSDIDEIPLKWFKTSEKIIRKYGGILNKDTVMELGVDAWRQWVVNSSRPSVRSSS